MHRRARPSAAPARAAAGLALAATLAGCADIHRAMEAPRINPESPVAPAVAAGADRNYAFPLLRDVPPVPKNLLQPGDVKTQVGNLVTCRRAMAGYVVDHPPLSGETVAFAADERAVANITEADVPAPDSAAKAEAYAAQLREEAAPPPAISSGPPPTPQQAMPPAPAAPAPTPSARAPQTVAKARPAPPAAEPPSPTAAPAGTMGATAVTPVPTPPLPAPLTDPLLARCS